MDALLCSSTPSQDVWEYASVSCADTGLVRGDTPTMQPVSMEVLPTIAPSQRWTPYATFTISFVLAPINGMYAYQEMTVEDSMSYWLMQLVDEILNLNNNLQTLVPIMTTTLEGQHPPDDDRWASGWRRFDTGLCCVRGYCLTLLHNETAQSYSLLIAMNATLNVIDYLYRLPSAPSSLNVTSILTDAQQNQFAYELLLHFRSMFTNSLIASNPTWQLVTSTWLQNIPAWFGDDIKALLVSDARIDMINVDSASHPTSAPTKKSTEEDKFGLVGLSFLQSLIIWIVIGVIVVGLIPSVLIFVCRYDYLSTYRPVIVPHSMNEPETLPMEYENNELVDVVNVEPGNRIVSTDIAVV